MKVTLFVPSSILLLLTFASTTKDGAATIPPNARKAQLLDTLRKAQIDPQRLAQDSDALSEALHEQILDNPDAPIDLLSVIRLQCRVEHDSSNPAETAPEMQARCTAEMFDLTQQASIAPPNVTLAFGSDPYAKNQDFVAWCLRLLTSNYFQDKAHIESLRRDMILQNPYWKAAVKATYLSVIPQERAHDFDTVIQDPELWAEAVGKLKERHQG